MQKGQALILVLAAILIITAVAGGAYFVGKLTNKSPQSQNPVVTSQTPQPTPSPSPVDETVNWKEYTNTTNAGFSVKYPTNWLINNEFSQSNYFGVEFGNQKREVGGSSTDGYQAVVINFYQNGFLLPQNGAIKEYLSVNIDLTYFIRIEHGLLPDQDFNSVKKTTRNIAGYEAIKFKSDNGRFNTPWTIKTGRGIYSFDEIYGNKMNIQDYQLIFDQILSTFKFLQ